MNAEQLDQLISSIVSNLNLLGYVGDTYSLNIDKIIIPGKEKIIAKAKKIEIISELIESKPEIFGMFGIAMTGSLKYCGKDVLV